MTISFLTILFLSVVLIGISFYFLSFYLRSRKRESLAIQSFEETKSKLREEVSTHDSIMGLLASIHEIVLENYGGGTKSSLAQMILHSACGMMGCPMGALQLVEKSTQELKGMSVQGFSEEQLESLGCKVGEGISGQVAGSGRIVVVDDLGKDERLIADGGLFPASSMISVPLKVNNRVVGVLSVCAEEPHHLFEEKKIHLLNILCAQSAIALENLDLYRNLQDFYVEMAQTLSQRLDREGITNQLEPLRGYARRVAQELRLPESISMYVEFALILRGIGRSEVDELLLHKPGKLTSQEYDQVKKIPEIGEKMIAGIRFLMPVKPMILYHQEHWNGAGYPLGLKGEEIPLGSRIIAVLNAFHAMTTDRPYRKALSEREAIRELKGQAGIQFDPAVVEAFVRVHEGSKKVSSGLQEIRSGNAAQQTTFDNFWEWN
ncbi:MAG: GAF domain-containing protein [Elusimicrobia bacterium]|nr:GAF domain-containing protein [Elusimicrobiota bacterium]MBI2915388.1 GAF domain-containing protein [Elusimicrobiota bacterium]MBI4218019.1 GAF domain-containing protein [Elusimicrobiota bacterium]